MSSFSSYLDEKKCCLFQENTSRGPIGLKGSEGDSGPSGLPGLTGPTGISGTKGAAVRGDSGPTGPLNTANKLQKISLFDNSTPDYNTATIYDSIILIPPPPSGITLLAGKYAIQWSLSIPLGSLPPDSFVYLSFESTQTVNIYNTNVYDELNPCAMIIQGTNMTACGNEILNITEDDLIQCSVNFKATTTLTNIQCYFNVSINPNPLSIL